MFPSLPRATLYDVWFEYIDLDFPELLFEYCLICIFLRGVAVGIKHLSFCVFWPPGYLSALYRHTTLERFEKRRKPHHSEIVGKRHSCSEMKTERFAVSCEHKRCYLFVPLANQASQVSKQ